METLEVDERQPEPMDLSVPIGVRAHVAVAADHSAEVPKSIVVGLTGWLRDDPRSQQLVVGGEEGTLVRAVLGAGHVLPPSVREEAMVTACDELRAIFEPDAVRVLHRPPAREDSSLREVVVLRPRHGAVDVVANPKVGQLLGSTVAHE